jgi:hypothetical protein
VAGTRRVGRRYLMIAATTLVVAAIALGVFLVERGSGQSSLRPFKTGNTAGAGLVVGFGKPASWGLVELQNETDRPVRLERVELLGLDPALHVIAIWAAGPHRGPNWGLIRGTASSKERDLHPIGGMLVPPRGAPGWSEGVQLLVTASSKTPGIVGFRKLALDWTADGKHGRTVFPYDFYICAPKTFPQSKCEVPLPSP